ncbi:hypothetical protein H0H87_006313 [Tephrocybe sp. NHM501043]|nr:hypothetical protein H0H87_006313 [Tephrocybe sp. NHM501043]
MFSTLMNERHGTKIAVFGGKPGENVEFKGMAGNQVLEWANLDTEIKTANLKNVRTQVRLWMYSSLRSQGPCTVHRTPWPPLTCECEALQTLRSSA